MIQLGYKHTNDLLDLKGHTKNYQQDTKLKCVSVGGLFVGFTSVDMATHCGGCVLIM